MKPKQTPGLEVRTAGDEVLVHDAKQGKVHVLNATAGKILQLCDGSRTVEEIAVALANAFLTDTERVRPDVDAALVEFRGLGLLEA
jgi:PqqD family protein of HPr-rel-A system